MKKNNSLKIINTMTLIAALIIAGLIILLLFRNPICLDDSCCLVVNVQNASGITDSLNETDNAESQLYIDPSVLIVKQLIKAKGSGSEDVSELLTELNDLDSSKGDLWKNILTYWDRVNESGFTGGELLPPDLPDDNSLCIVVMGFALNNDGTMRNDLILRLIEALKCAEQYPNAYVLVTGGPTARDKKDSTEADSMAQWLIDNGIEENRLIIENKSLTTASNAIYAQEILYKQYPQVKSIAIVTSDYHVPLSCLLFNSQFMLADAAGRNADSGPRVIANASCIPESSYVFDLAHQAKWMNLLFDANQP